MATTKIAWLGATFLLFSLASCSNQNAPSCDDSDVEAVVADIARRQLALILPRGYQLTEESRHHFKSVIASAEAEKDDAIAAHQANIERLRRDARASRNSHVDPKWIKLQELQAAWKAKLQQERDTWNEKVAAARAKITIAIAEEQAAYSLTPTAVRKKALQTARTARRTARQEVLDIQAAAKQATATTQSTANQEIERARIAHRDAVNQADQAMWASFRDAETRRDDFSEAILIAGEKLTAAKNAFEEAREAVTERAVDDATRADVQLSNIIMVEQLATTRSCECEATLTTHLNTEPMGRIADTAAYTIDPEAMVSTFDVAFKAHYTADYKQVRVSMSGMGLLDLILQ